MQSAGAASSAAPPPPLRGLGARCHCVPTPVPRPSHGRHRSGVCVPLGGPAGVPPWQSRGLGAPRACAEPRAPVELVAQSGERVAMHVACVRVARTTSAHARSLVGPCAACARSSAVIAYITHSCSLYVRASSRRRCGPVGPARCVVATVVARSAFTYLTLFLSRSAFGKTSILPRTVDRHRDTPILRVVPIGVTSCNEAVRAPSF